MLELALRYCDQTGPAQQMLNVGILMPQRIRRFGCGSCWWPRLKLVSKAKVGVFVPSWCRPSRAGFVAGKENLSYFPVSDLVSWVWQGCFFWPHVNYMGRLCWFIQSCFTLSFPSRFGVSAVAKIFGTPSAARRQLSFCLLEKTKHCSVLLLRRSGLHITPETARFWQTNGCTIASNGNFVQRSFWTIRISVFRLAVHHRHSVQPFLLYRSLPYHCPALGTSACRASTPESWDCEQFVWGGLGLDSQRRAHLQIDNTWDCGVELMIKFHHTFGDAWSKTSPLQLGIPDIPKK